MKYTVYTKYLNGATGNQKKFDTKGKAYSHLKNSIANTDLLKTASAVIVKNERREIYRHEIQDASCTVPDFTEIKWPRRGRSPAMKDCVTITVVVEKEDATYLKALGGGITSRGVRMAVVNSRQVVGVMDSE